MDLTVTQLKEAVQRYESIIEYSPTPVFTFDLEGRVTSMNPAGERVIGYSRHELLGRSFKDLVAENFLDEAIQHFQQALQGESQCYECMARLKDRNATWVEVTYIPIIVYGQVQGVYGVVKDIHEVCKKVESVAAQILQRELPYRLVADTIDELIEILDVHGVVQYASPSHERVLGFSPSEYIGHAVLPKIHPDDASSVADRFLDIVKAKKPTKMEWRYLCKDGTYVWVEARGTPMVDANGQVETVLVVARDISERKVLEQALRTSEENYRLISENSNDLISVVDHRGIIKYASPSFETLLGIQPCEYEGRTFFDMIEPGDVPAMVEKFSEMKQGKELRNIVYTFLHKKGHGIPVEANAIPIFSEAGDVDRIMVVARDIRSRIESQQALEESEKRYSLIAKNSSDLIRLASAPSGNLYLLLFP
ncbi:MAG: PAS domain-containing protein [Alicyclobacillus herbarius]|uniref:PAS domain-containing protein n=1 Tax=Alicyclobacillus herbarius TaxID=122960 RepID=UPI002357E62E|nr:PAS domain-containing protein [Alicyclobacillus herbarius]MCL6633003.1 PAS domain-containing protein [Alicyclobacillus herbarius]